MFRRVFRPRYAKLAIEMPPDVLEAVFHLDRELGIKRASHDPVVADGPVAVETHAIQPHDEDVSRHRRLAKERTGLRVTAPHARHALLVGSAGVDRCRVDGVARPDAG